MSSLLSALVRLVLRRLSAVLEVKKEGVPSLSAFVSFLHTLSRLSLSLLFSLSPPRPAPCG